MTSPIITEALRALVDRRNLTRIEAAAAMEAIMSGAATGAQIGAFLTALRMKGETVEELIGFAQVMRQKAVHVRTRGEEVANGIVEALGRVQIGSPIVIRIDGTNADEGRKILEPHLSDHLQMQPTMLDAAKTAVELAGGTAK